MPDDPTRFVLRRGRFQLVELSWLAPAARLICRHCTARPREARAALIELAERTLATGRRDAYV